MTSPVAQRALIVAVGALAAAITLTACSGSSASSGGGTSPGAPTSSAPGSGAPSGPGQRGPAASGTVAAIAGTTMQVQNQQTGQLAVSWTSSTKFSHQVTTTLTAVKAGDCVTAVAPSGTAATAPSFTAASLVVSPATNGTCTGFGGGGGGGQRPSGFPSGGQRPSGFPSGGSGRPQIGAIASGQVTSVSGSTLVIAAREFGSDAGSTTNKTVTAAASTKITTDASTTAGSVQVGKCVTAQGKADSSGTIAATTVRITDPTNGQCSTRFGGNGG